MNLSCQNFSMKNRHFNFFFQCLKDDDMNLNFPNPLEDWLMRALENYICVSQVQKVLLFLLLARSMGKKNALKIYEQFTCM